MEKQKTNTVYTPIIILSACILFSLLLKLLQLKIGAPYTTIDDNTLYDAGFLVWFGEPPPQRLYFESWLTGIISLATYIITMLFQGNLSALNMNIVANAFTHFQHIPETYVLNYRIVMLLFDFATAFLVYKLTVKVLPVNIKPGWFKVIPASLFLLSYNTLWCNIVARPDTMTTFFAVWGMLHYYYSDFGKQKKHLLLSAILLGIAAGFKMHAAIFAIFVCIDLLRVHGIKKGVGVSAGFAGLSLFFFLISAGSPLFDPLLYVKLRALNAKDDASPWIRQGHQFLVMIRGSSWLSIPLGIFSVWAFFQTIKKNRSGTIGSLITLFILLLLFFSPVRVLRAYWMLPAIPFFYLLAVWGISLLRLTWLKTGVVALFLVIAAIQFYQQSTHFRGARYGEFQQWTKNNLQPTQNLYIVGFETLFLPYSSTCKQKRVALTQKMLSISDTTSEDFTNRHVRFWEERASLMLLEMYQPSKKSGFNYFALYTTPMKNLEGILDYNDITYFAIMDGVKKDDCDGLLEKIHSDCAFVTRVHSPGGKAGTGGLPFDIYIRKNHGDM